MSFAAAEAVNAGHDGILGFFLLISRPHLALDVSFERSRVAPLDLFQRQLHTEPMVSPIDDRALWKVLVERRSALRKINLLNRFTCFLDQKLADVITAELFQVAIAK